MIHDHPPTDDALYMGDGEWMEWADFDQHFHDQQRGAQSPQADVALVEIFDDLIRTARDYHHHTGRHLQIYGDLGELFGQIVYGIKLHRNYARGSDGRLGNDLVEIKTITPFKTEDVVEVNFERNFNKILIVKIDRDFAISAKLIDRKPFGKTRGKRRISWDSLLTDDAIKPSAPHP